MPTYVYKFLDTGETLEVQQSFDDAALTEAAHPVTGDTMAVKKVYLPVGVTFKGDGFYKTDNRSSSKKSGASDGSGSSSDKSGSSSDKSGSSSDKSSSSSDKSSSSSDKSGSSSSGTSSSSGSSGSSGSSSTASSSSSD